MKTHSNTAKRTLLARPALSAAFALLIVTSIPSCRHSSGELSGGIQTYDGEVNEEVYRGVIDARDLGPQPLQLIAPAADATVWLSRYATEPCMFKLARDGQLEGFFFNWQTGRDRIPLAHEALRREPSIPVDFYLVCVLYGSQQCNDETVRIRMALDAGANTSPPGMPTTCAFNWPIQAHDACIPAKAWRVYPIARQDFVDRAAGPPVSYRVYPGATGAGTPYFSGAINPRTGTTDQFHWQVQTCGRNTLLQGSPLSCRGSEKRAIRFSCQNG